MAELALDRDFLPAFARLQRAVQKAVLDALGKFSEHTHAGLHLERIAQSRDPNIRTIRITQFYRGLVLALGQEKYLLLDVLPHDDAIRYATSRVFSVNQVLGVLEVRDESRMDEFTQNTATTPAAKSLFKEISTADLTRLGIDEETVKFIRLVSTDEQLESLHRVLPQAQMDVLLGLASGLTVHEVLGELADRIVHGVDIDDLAAAAQRTPERVRFVTGPVDLEAILAHPFDLWRTFLHPTQHEVAYRKTYSGPALITGSAGTGKTVTGLHRAVFLAERLDTGKVLLTTYTRALADALARQLRRLTTDRSVLDRIDVLGVDQLAYGVLRQGQKLTLVEDDVLIPMFAEAAKTGPAHLNRAGAVTTFSGTFLRREWEQVILAQNLTSLDAYQQATRRGRGDALRADQRTQIWNLIDGVVTQLARRRMRTHTQVADEAARIAGRQPPIYRHIVVDEGQDLHPAQWRLLRALVEPGPDDLFLLADPHQRIYDSQVSLSRLGIDVRGRSRRLTVNYRTTREILDMSVRVLSGDSAIGLDGESDSLRGYRSVTNGERPRVTGHPTRTDEIDALVERVGTWLEKGVEPHAIGIAVRTGQLVKSVTAALTDAHIDVADDKRGQTGVVVSTMHRMKGLEFQCLALVSLDAGVLPAPNAITSAAEDPLANRQDLQRERCLMFVAMTRARDVLYLSHGGSPSNLLPASREPERR